MENSEKRDYDVFISYRRETGGTVAQALRANLRLHQLRVFLDVSDLKRGRFDETLLMRIASTPNFIVILSPNSLDRCNAEGDWLRQEIVQALKTERNIIPILMPKFEFPQDLPEEMQTLPRQQAVKYDHEYFEDMVEIIFARVEEERAETEQKSRYKSEQERIARELAVRKSRERAEADRRAAEQAEAERVAMLRAEEERKSRLVSQKMKSAQEAHRRWDMTTARNLLLEVLQVTPQNIEAKSLLAQIDAELASSQKKVADLFEQTSALIEETSAKGLRPLLERARSLAAENRREEARSILIQMRSRRHISPSVQKPLKEINHELSRFQRAGEIGDLLTEVAGLFEANSLEQATQVLRKASQKYRDPDLSNVLRWANNLRQEPETSQVCLTRAAALILKKDWIDARTLMTEVSPEVQQRPFFRELFQIIVENEAPVPEEPAATAVPPEHLQVGATSASETEPTGILPPSEPSATLPPLEPLSGAEAGSEAEKIRAAGPASSGLTSVVTAEPAQKFTPVAPPALPGRETAAVAASVSIPARPVLLRQRNVWVMIGIAAVAVVLVVLWVSLPKSTPTPGATTMGTVNLDVSPWAVVKEVRNTQTQKLENLTGQTTPVQLSLPAGDYQLVLAHPSLGNTKVALHVEAGSQQQVRQSFQKFDPDEVLKAYR